ncbi:MAG: peptide-methionine (S)-S-oxide reductase MsrA [Nitrososphaerota archaeon]|nr:peptide-methionine (S)-S-oxide reductase MsrA [Nitrososphaerota archaeon]MDG6966838.1 peptide-methionine (S)-S-oxide reductase MsrA [Nitrososphaerota archaeon]MDG6977998.1 peptide-methionine (S)-S-oxide reductase MsrA [Nitrososphaerota archaeon]MDG7020922.1 peptide-methionine (S)-S-oxide reductase MsrA [Nitrososphaerota archaeon]MDG7022611.1 peptide-methionine (S)-S-oxide reductase MsrA [Nitrososphaerota archaeon]
MEVLTLGGGCFWCLDAVFSGIRGVETVVSGYSGGRVPHPTYEEVCTGSTGHAEVVEVTFDPDAVSLRDLLKVFFTLHDPTTKDRQGDDVGTQYRSIVLYRGDDQREAAEEAVREVDASGVWDAKAVTELRPFEAFYPAEGYHQDYYRKNPLKPYCLFVIRPKVAKLRDSYMRMLRAT